MNRLRLWLAGPIVRELVMLRAENAALHKRVARAETWLVLLQQLTANRAAGSQALIQNDRMRHDDKTIDKALGPL